MLHDITAAITTATSTVATATNAATADTTATTSATSTVATAATADTTATTTAPAGGLTLTCHIILARTTSNLVPADIHWTVKTESIFTRQSKLSQYSLDSQNCVNIHWTVKTMLISKFA